MSSIPGHLPKSHICRHKKAAQSHDEMISADDGKGSSLSRLHDPEGESYFKGKQEDPNNAKMLTPVAPAVLFIACW